jgi:hypothetical protein
VEAIWNQFYKVSQSNTYENCVFSEIESKIYVAVPPLGSAPSAGDVQQLLGLDNNNRLLVLNEGDSFCLFYAIALGIGYSDQKEIKECIDQQRAPPPYLLSSDAFRHDYWMEPETIKRDAIALMSMANIDQNKEAYGLIIIIKHTFLIRRQRL